jgi:hypothetical protein
MVDLLDLFCLFGQFSLFTLFHVSFTLVETGVLDNFQDAETTTAS